MISLFEAFIEYVQDHDDAQFVTLETVAQKYRDDPSVYEPEGDYV